MSTNRSKKQIRTLRMKCKRRKVNRLRARQAR